MEWLSSLYLGFVWCLVSRRSARCDGCLPESLASFIRQRALDLFLRSLPCHGGEEAAMACRASALRRRLCKSVLGLLDPVPCLFVCLFVDVIHVHIEYEQI